MSQIKKYIAFYGTGGCARSLLPIMKEVDNEFNLLFVDDFKKNDYINKVNVVSFEELLALSENNKIEIVVSISNFKVRKKIVEKLSHVNLPIYNLISNRSYIMDLVSYKEGIIISPFVTIGSNVTIGKHFHANLYSYVEHDCVIGDYVTFAPGVRCNGNVHIEDNVFIGSGATIINGNKNEKIIIGKNTIIGAGAVILNSLKPNSKYVGNPAREIK